MQTTIYKRDKQQVLLYSTGNYIQYPVINHNEKEYEKEYIYIYITESLSLSAKVRGGMGQGKMCREGAELRLKDE